MSTVLQFPTTARALTRRMTAAARQARALERRSRGLLSRRRVEVAAERVLRGVAPMLVAGSERFAAEWQASGEIEEMYEDRGGEA